MARYAWSVLATLAAGACEPVVEPPPDGPYSLPVAHDLGIELSTDSTGFEIHISFATDFDQSDVAEYRTFLVPQSTAYRFDLQAALTVPPGRYTASPPGDASHEARFPDDAATADGDALVAGTAYVGFVLTVASPAVPLAIDAMSEPSAAVVASASVPHRAPGSGPEDR